jgi:RHS repeat-associated protein
MKYDAFGKVTWMNANFGTIANSAYAWNRTYTGQVLDSETGLMLYRNRYYHTGLGRFVTRDPIKYRGRDVSLYRYVGNRTIRYSDPRGLQFSSDIFRGIPCSNSQAYYAEQAFWQSPQGKAIKEANAELLCRQLAEECGELLQNAAYVAYQTRDVTIAWAEHTEGISKRCASILKTLSGGLTFIEAMFWEMSPLGLDADFSHVWVPGEGYVPRWALSDCIPCPPLPPVPERPPVKPPCLPEWDPENPYGDGPDDCYDCDTGGCNGRYYETVRKGSPNPNPRECTQVPC